VAETTAARFEPQVKRADLCLDVGSSLNPAIDVGQVEGAFAQGMGWRAGGSRRLAGGSRPPRPRVRGTTVAIRRNLVSAATMRPNPL
jgi:hypothetical protein